MKRNIKIPVVVAANGEIQTGSFGIAADGACYSQHDYSIDGLSDDGYKSGHCVVFVEAEIDVDSLFRERTIQGSVSNDCQVPEASEIDSGI